MTAEEWIKQHIYGTLEYEYYFMDGKEYNVSEALHEICSRMMVGTKAKDIAIQHREPDRMTEILAGKDGGSTPAQYAFSGCSSMQELVRYRGMKRNIAAIFKACIPVAQGVPESMHLLDNMIESAHKEIRSQSEEEPDFSYGTGIIPVQCHEIQDLIEYYQMNFSIGNIFKACYRIGHCDHSSKERDLNKCIWFATREFRRWTSPPIPQ